MMSKDIKTDNYTLLFGDCLERMKEIPDGSVDLILTDPPYGTTACKWDSVIDFTLMWAELNRVIKHNGAIVLFGSEPFSSMLRCSNLKMFKYDLVWEKSKGSNFVHSKYQPLKTHENIIVFSKGGAAQGSKIPMKYYPQMTIGIPYDKGFGHNKINTLNGGLSKASSIHLKNEKTNNNIIFSSFIQLFSRSRVLFPRSRANPFAWFYNLKY